MALKYKQLCKGKDESWITSGRLMNLGEMYSKGKDNKFEFEFLRNTQVL